MTQKEKAIAYDKALKVANKYKDTQIMFSSIQDEMFPELKESEDERIRKALIRYFTLSDEHAYNEACGVSYRDIVAWLEKQSRNPYSGVSFEYNDNVWGMCARDNGVDILFNKKLIQHISGEKQGKQNPVDKSEPKFKQGDWIIFNGLVLRVGGVSGGFYVTTSKDGITNGYDWSIDNAARLWTIADAKDGDVLAVEDMVFIYKRILSNHVVSYCTLYHDNFDHFVYGRTCHEGNSNLHPATKEQRDALMKAMADAGYAFDFEKKELSKIEEPVKWSEEDNLMVESIIHTLSYNRDHGATAMKIDFLKSLRNRVQPQIKQGWSEEDEINSNICISLMKTHSLCDKDIITWFESLKYRVQPKQDSTDRFFEGFKKGEQSVIENYGKYGLCKPTEWCKEDEKTIHLVCEFIRHHSSHNDSIGGVDCSILIERLKSLISRSQWKPSDEQMERLKGTINSLPRQEVLYSLYQDLKRLKGEHS